MSTVKTSTERGKKLRSERKELGLKRLELHAHPDDWPKIKKFSSSLLDERFGCKKTDQETKK